MATPDLDVLRALRKDWMQKRTQFEIDLNTVVPHVPVGMRETVKFRIEAQISTCQDMVDKFDREIRLAKGGS